MTRMSRTITWLLVVLTSGCASIDVGAGFDAVRRSVRERTGHELRTPDQALDPQQVGARVRELIRSPLTAESAVAIALLANPRLQASLRELEITHADFAEAGLIANPTLSAEVRFPPRPQVPFEVDLGQDLVTILFRPLRLRIAEADLEARKGEEIHGVVSLVGDVERAFIEAQAAAEQVVLAELAARTAQASVVAAEGLFAAGNVPNGIVVTERAAAEELEIVLASARVEARARREQLNRLLGLWGADLPWTIEPRLADVPDEAIPADELESWALAQRADFDAQRWEARAQNHAGELAAYAGWLPGVAVVAHYEHEPERVGTIGPSIELTLPIFHQGQPEVARADARLGQALDELAARAIDIRSEVRGALDRLELARSGARRWRDVVIPLRRQITTETVSRFYAMEVGAFELLSARRGEIEAGKSYVAARRDYWVARADLLQSLGGRLPAGAAAGDAP